MRVMANMKSFVIAVWTALALALVEFVTCIIVGAGLYLIQCQLLRFPGFFGDNPFQTIWSDNIQILVMRIGCGSVLSTAIVLFLIHFWPRSYHWAVLGVINVSVLLLMAAVCNLFFVGLFRMFFDFDSTLYRNPQQILTLVCFFSPLLVSKLRLGTMLPNLVSYKAVHGK
jgi:hypothetical protein